MEKVEIAALSKIADILADNINSPIIPKEDIWKKIFYNAELGDLFEERSPQFRIVIEGYGWGNNEKNLYHNDRTYNAIFESFRELEYRFEELVKMLNNMAEKMSLHRVFIEDVEEKVKKDYPKSRIKYFEDFFKQVDNEEKNKIINKYSTKGFRTLRRNFNIIGTEIFWDNDTFSVIPFADRGMESNFDINVINQWLHRKYPNVCESYEDARKAFGNGDEVGCITHCRNIITGIFSYKKEEGKEWYSGLQKVCAADKNITSLINAKAIPSIKYDVHSDDKKQRYKYPRFNLINKLYVLTCDLGAHINEGNIDGGVVDSEIATIEDALLALRITEDMLIWLYQTGNIDK